MIGYEVVSLWKDETALSGSVMKIESNNRTLDVSVKEMDRLVRRYRIDPNFIGCQVNDLNNFRRVAFLNKEEQLEITDDDNELLDDKLYEFSENDQNCITKGVWLEMYFNKKDNLDMIHIEVDDCNLNAAECNQRDVDDFRDVVTYYVQGDRQISVYDLIDKHPVDMTEDDWKQFFEKLTKAIDRAYEQIDEFSFNRAVDDLNNRERYEEDY